MWCGVDRRWRPKRAPLYRRGRNKLEMMAGDRDEFWWDFAGRDDEFEGDEDEKADEC